MRTILLASVLMLAGCVGQQQLIKVNKEVQKNRVLINELRVTHGMEKAPDVDDVQEAWWMILLPEIVALAVAVGIPGAGALKKFIA